MLAIGWRAVPKAATVVGASQQDRDDLVDILTSKRYFVD